MRRTRDKPTYPLDEVKRLARDESITMNGRVMRFIANRCVSRGVKEYLRDLICSIEPEDFYKSDELDYRPGTFADIYKGTFFDDEEWYIKLLIDEQGWAHLHVASANWDGYIH